MTPTFEQRANMYRVAYMLGAATIDELTAWADTEIQALPVPSNALIDISLGRRLPIANVIASLNELAIDTHDRWSTRCGMSKLARRIRAKQIDAQTAILRCYEYLRNQNMLYDDDFIVFVTLEDDVSLIRDGIFGNDMLTDMHDEVLLLFDQMESETRVAE